MKAALLACVLLALGAAKPLHAADGETVFRQNCMMCHQSGATGLAGQFPRLAGRVGAIAAVPDARPWLVQVVVYGMSGNITVDRQPIMGMMPEFAQIPDADVAALLNHLNTLGKAPRKPPATFTAEEVKAVRAGPAMSPTDVHAARATLGIAKIAP